MSLKQVKPLESISLISSPYHRGLRGEGPGAGPGFLRSHGLVQALQNLGVVVHELDIDPFDDFEGDIGRSFELIGEPRTSKSLSGADIGCVWFDAHDDYNTPDTVIGGHFDSMGIAMPTNQCWKALLAMVPGHRPVEIQKIVHVGMRDVTTVERARVIDPGLDVVWGGSEEHVDFAERLGEKLATKVLGPTMVHVDLDCLDMSLGQVNKFAAPGELFEDDLLECLKSIVTMVEPTSLTMASFDPSYDCAENIARIAIEGVVAFVASLASKGLVSVHSKA